MVGAVVVYAGNKRYRLEMLEMGLRRRVTVVTRWGGEGDDFATSEHQPERGRGGAEGSRADVDVGDTCGASLPSYAPHRP
jgi:hypothetical protein